MSFERDKKSSTFAPDFQNTAGASHNLLTNQPSMAENSNTIMATKTKKTQVATKAIDELIEVTAIERQSAKRIKELRDDAKKEAIELYKAKKWPVGKDMPLGDATIRLYQEKVCTWEKNTKIKDSLLDIYCSQLEHIKWLEEQVAKTKAEAKMTSRNLELAYPDSESIKYELKFQIR